MELHRGKVITHGPELPVVQMPRSLPFRLKVHLQDLGEERWTLPDNTTTTRQILFRTIPVSDLANAVDYAEVAITETAVPATPQLDQRFYLAEKSLQDTVLEGTARVVLKVGAKGDGTNATYIDRIAVDVEKVDAANTYTTLASSDITLTTELSNAATAWTTWDWQVFFNLGRTGIERDENLCLRVRIWAYMATGGTAQAIRLYYQRGTEDSYLEIPLDEIV